MLIQRRTRRSPLVQIVSMIDVMFFLVTFLLLFATFDTAQQAIPVELPKAATAQDRPATELVVTITREGAFYLGDQLVTVQGLKNAVSEAVRNNAQIVAVIRADREAIWDWVVAAIDALTEAGGSSLSFTVERPSR